MIILCVFSVTLSPFQLDHDVCSNYGNWLYSAGIGNDPRQDRKFNVIKQGTDYDADVCSRFKQIFQQCGFPIKHLDCIQGEYVRLWIPELAGLTDRSAHFPFRLPAAQLAQASVELGVTYPHPILVAPEWARHASASV